MTLEDDQSFLRLIEASRACLKAEGGTKHQILVDVAAIGPHGRSVRIVLAEGRAH